MSAENNVNESKPLEVPEVVPGAAAVEFPEINDFLSRMRIRSGLFGFQKEDVFAKMQELNTLYQNRLQQNTIPGRPGEKEAARGKTLLHSPSLPLHHLSYRKQKP